ncbi:transglycosylase domain-containing protein [Gilliamella sp. BG7]|uniref:transglycosylase domain-containing protein n=1 Tax=unclassified Gilliamella TaxID=2685620 RepID=UPI0039865472
MMIVIVYGRLWKIFRLIVVTKERWFYYHIGFNPFSLIRAFEATYFGGGNRQGASTITIQLAQIHWRSNTKTVGGKLHQITRAIQLELMYSKHDILEAYLNYAPFGRNIESVGAASFIYFNKPPSQVNLPEALTLEVLHQSPTFRVDRKTGFADKALIKARNQYLREPNRTLPPNLKRIDIYLTSGNLLIQ